MIGDRTSLYARNIFRFADAGVIEMLRPQLTRSGVNVTDAHRMVDDARTYVVDDQSVTDLAFIPRFLRWFANPYGAFR